MKYILLGLLLSFSLLCFSDPPNKETALALISCKSNGDQRYSISFMKDLGAGDAMLREVAASYPLTAIDEKQMETVVRNLLEVWPVNKTEYSLFSFNKCITDEDVKISTSEIKKCWFLSKVFDGTDVIHSLKMPQEFAIQKVLDGYPEIYLEEGKEIIGRIYRQNKPSPQASFRYLFRCLTMNHKKV